MTRKFESPCYCTNARRIATTLSDYYDCILAPVGVNVAQFCLLRNLQRIGQANLTAWAEQTGIERSTMVRDAKRLDEIGLIERVNGRGKIYTLSAEEVRTLTEGALLWEQAQRNIEIILGEDCARSLLSIGKKIQDL